MRELIYGRNPVMEALQANALQVLQQSWELYDNKPEFKDMFTEELSSLITTDNE